MEKRRLRVLKGLCTVSRVCGGRPLFASNICRRRIAGRTSGSDYRPKPTFRLRHTYREDVRGRSWGMVLLPNGRLAHNHGGISAYARNVTISEQVREAHPLLKLSFEFTNACCSTAILFAFSFRHTDVNLILPCVRLLLPKSS